MKNNIKKYDIWLINLDPIKGSEQAGTRPCLIYQSNFISKYTKTFIVFPITGKEKRSASIVVKLKDYKNLGLSKESTILTFQIRTVDKSRFIKKLGELNDQKTREQIRESLKIVLDLDDEFLE